MVRKAERQYMALAVATLLERHGNYRVIERDLDHLTLASPDPRLEGVELFVFLHGAKRPVSEYVGQVRDLAKAGKSMTNIFLKDGKNFHVRLAERGHIKGNNRSLKNYSKAQYDRMLHLSDLEAETLARQPRSDVLVYFQPRTERLLEGLRPYAMERVMLDYSHLPGKTDHEGRKQRLSLDYRIANEQFGIAMGLFVKPISFEPAFQYAPMGKFRVLTIKP